MKLALQTLVKNGLLSQLAPEIPVMANMSVFHGSLPETLIPAPSTSRHLCGQSAPEVGGIMTG